MDYVDCLVRVQLTHYIIAQRHLLYRKIMYIFQGKRAVFLRKKGILAGRKQRKDQHQAKGAVILLACL